MLKKSFFTLLALLAIAAAATGPVRAQDYYLAGSMNTWATDNAAYKFTYTDYVNAYTLTTTLEENSEFKVVSPLEWYPSSGDNYVVQSTGTYTIYFDPAGNHDGWYGGYFNVVEGTLPAAHPAVPQKYTSTVAASALQVGDTLAQGFSVTFANQYQQFMVNANRYKMKQLIGQDQTLILNGENESGIQTNGPLSYVENCGIRTGDLYPVVYLPYTGTRDGNAWVVTALAEYEQFGENFLNVHISGIYIPVPRTLSGIPEGWSVTADGNAVTVTDGSATILEGAQVELIPPAEMKSRVKAVTLTEVVNPTDIPLTLEAITAGTIVVNNPKSGMQYTLNGGAKTAYTSAIDVTASDKVAFYGDGTNITTYSGTKITGGTAQVKVYGNIMSLLDEQNYATATALPNQNSVFDGLFENNTTLIDASGLLLPATTLATSCYYAMFRGCTGLTAAPALPATTLANNCYNYMFRGCTGLTTAPALPATTLATSCYYAMFSYCTGLTAAPALPATTLATSCYSNMFSGCTGLTAAPALPATTLANSCYSNMFSGCNGLTAAPALPATTLANNCYNYMFRGCTGLTTAPALPATTLANDCYSNMFSGCTGLTAAPELPAPTLTEYCYNSMFQYCSNLSSVTCMATDISALNCTSNWLQYVATSGTFTTPSTTGWTTDSPNGIPSGWTRVNQ